jgi:hypothetical protein
VIEVRLPMVTVRVASILAGLCGRSTLAPSMVRLATTSAPARSRTWIHRLGDRAGGLSIWPFGWPLLGI